MVVRLAWLRQRPWHLAILDEAQAIKNAGSRQSRAVKELEAAARIALTGTPVENPLGGLGSLFDFLNPGLLGSAKAFAQYAKGLAQRWPSPVLFSLVGGPLSLFSLDAPSARPGLCNGRTIGHIRLPAIAPAKSLTSTRMA